MRWLGLALALAASAWIAHAALHFLSPSIPGYGLLIAVPMDGALHFENGSLHAISGELRAADFSPWWLPSILASVALLLALAARGCLVGRNVAGTIPPDLPAAGSR